MRDAPRGHGVEIGRTAQHPQRSVVRDVRSRLAREKYQADICRYLQTLHTPHTAGRVADPRRCRRGISVSGESDRTGTVRAVPYVTTVSLGLFSPLGAAIYQFIVGVSSRGVTCAPASLSTSYAAGPEETPLVSSEKPWAHRPLRLRVRRPQHPRACCGGEARPFRRQQVPLRRHA